jgi:hypothetical protein
VPALLVVALRAAVAVAAAQAPAPQTAVAPDTGFQAVVGRVTVARGATRVPLAGTWVTLHRVAPDAAGPLDSMRAAAGGAFHFRYRTRPGAHDAYFVSAMHDGLAYFSQRLGPGAARDGSADLVVYDTASAGVDIAIASRHVVVAAPDPTGARRVIEMYVLSNDGTRTLVPGAGGQPTFTAMLPAGALQARAGDGDVRADAMAFTGDTVAVATPIAPGTRRVTFEYLLPRGATRAILGASPPVGLLDLLVEDSAGTAAGAGLDEQPSGAYAGRTFRHFAASNVAAGQTVTLSLPAMAAGLALDVATTLVAFVAVALTVVLVRTVRRSGPMLAAPGHDG